MSVLLLLCVSVWGSSGAACSPGPTTAGRRDVGSGAAGRSPVIGCDRISSSTQTLSRQTDRQERTSQSASERRAAHLRLCRSVPLILSFLCSQQRGYAGKMLGGQLKRPGPPLGEHSVIQHTPSPSLHPSSRPPAEDCPSPSKRKKSSDQVQTTTPSPDEAELGLLSVSIEGCWFY